MNPLQWLPESGSPWLLGLIGAVSFALAFVGAAVGLILGHLRLPLLIRYLDSSPAGAACNLLVSGTGALSGTFRHIRDGRVSWSCLAVMGLPSVVGAAVAAFLFSRHVSHFWSHLLIGLMLIVSGVNLVWKGKKTAPPAGQPGRSAILLEILIGLGLGALAAITGLMLGSLRLPMMIRWLRLDPRVAVGSNMAIGCMTALVAAVISFLSGKDVAWGPIQQTLVVLAPPTILGGYLGSWLTGKLSKESVQALAGWIILATGVLMAGESVRALTVKPTAQMPEWTDDEPLDYDFDDD